MTAFDLDDVVTTLRLSQMERARLSQHSDRDLLLRGLRRLLRGQTMAPEDADKIRRGELREILAKGQQRAFVISGEPLAAAAAARTLRNCSRPADALSILEEVDINELQGSDKAKILTVMAAALTDLNELERAQILAKRAIHCDVEWREYPERVLARIASIRGDPAAAQALMEQADSSKLEREKKYKAALSAEGDDSLPF